MSDGSAQAATTSQRPSISGPDPLIGRFINERFKVVALIARGGMGKVYRAEQSPLGRTCALKVLNPNYAGEHDPEFHKRFFLEASIASKLTHPNTVTIFDYGRTDDDIYYMAMEYLEGRTLHRAIREQGPFAEERAAHVARQVCRSLREAHSLGVIHRDLKPANIFLVEHADEHDFVKVLDFGLVKNVSENHGEDLTQAGLFMGSPKYMAPEQIKGDRVDGRTDIYSLGVILYEMVTGKVPFDRANSVNIMMAHVNELPPPMRSINPALQLSPAMEELILCCLEKDPDRRFASMEQLLNALKGMGGAAVMTATLSGALATGEYLASSSSPSSSGVVPPPAVSPPSTGPHPSPSFLSTTGSLSGTGSVLSQTGAVLAHGMASSPNPSLYPSEPRRGSRSVLSLTVIGALVLGLIGVGLYAVRGQVSAFGPAAPTTPSASVALPAAAEPQPSAKTQPAESASVAPASEATVRIESDPPGAKVKEDSKELCSATPCDVVFKGDEAQPTKVHKLTIVKDGYREESKAVQAGDKSVSIKLSAYTRPGRTPPRSTAGSTNTSSTPPGFKDIPY